MSMNSFNPYFIGLPILINKGIHQKQMFEEVFQSLFYWITYSYPEIGSKFDKGVMRFNPYFIGLPILIIRR